MTDNTKISQFSYIKLPLLALVQEHALFLLRESLFWTFRFVFFYFYSNFTVSIVQRTLHRCKHDLSCAASLMNLPFRFVVVLFIFHITKLQLYSHIFKFKFLFSNAHKKQKYFVSSATSLTRHLRLQKCSPSSLSALLSSEVQGETVREESKFIWKTLLILSTSTFFNLLPLYIHFFFWKTDNHKSIKKKHEMK